MINSISAGIVLLGFSAFSAAADPAATGPGAPDATDLRVYVFCSDIAAQRPLSFEEAIACGRAFDRVKLAFVPGVNPEDFEALSTRDRAAVSLVGYKHFREWFDANSREIDRIKREVRRGLVSFGD